MQGASSEHCSGFLTVLVQGTGLPTVYGVLQSARLQHLHDTRFDTRMRVVVADTATTSLSCLYIQYRTGLLLFVGGQAERACAKCPGDRLAVACMTRH